MDRTTYEPFVVPWLVDGGFRVVNADLRGHGQTGWADSYRALDFAGDVADLIRGLDTGPVMVVGHSLGGLTGAALAAEHPDLVRALFLEDPPLFQGDAEIHANTDFITRQPPFIELIRQWQGNHRRPQDLADEMLAWPYAGNQTLLDVLGRDGVRDWATSILKFDPDALQAGVDGNLWLGYDPYTPLDCPVTVLAADADVDAVFFPEHEDLLRSAAPQTRVVQAEGSPHLIHLEERGLKTFLEELERILDSL